MEHRFDKSIWTYIPLYLYDIIWPPPHPCDIAKGYEYITDKDGTVYKIIPSSPNTVMTQQAIWECKNMYIHENPVTHTKTLHSSFGKKNKKKKTYKGYTLVSIKPSTRSGKKMMATFKHTTTGRTKTTHFGASRYQDFRQHKDPQRKQRYINRHRKRENWKDPMTAGALSLYILWNKPTLKASVADYKKRFF